MVNFCLKSQRPSRIIYVDIMIQEKGFIDGTDKETGSKNIE